MYSRADINAAVLPPVMGTSAMRRVVTGRRIPASGISRNWRVHFVVVVVLVEDELGKGVDGGSCCWR